MIPLGGARIDPATIPRPRRGARGAQVALRDPTRHDAARKRKSGRSAPFDFAQGRRDDKQGGRDGRERGAGWQTG